MPEGRWGMGSDPRQPVADSGPRNPKPLILIAVALLLAAVAVIGFLVVREKLNQRRLPRRKMGRQDAGGPPQVIYVAEDEGAFNLASIDLKKWGF